MDIGDYISVGKVLEVYPKTYTALVEVKNSSRNEFGKFVECKITALKINSLGAASVNLPMPQDMVYISTQWSKTHPSIVGYYAPTNSEPRPSEFHHKLTPVKDIGGNDTNLNGGSNHIRGKGPQDLLPGDQLISGEEGQTLGVLTGGSVIAKATALCQMILTKTRQTMLLVGRRFRLITDFGEISAESENGQAYLRIRGNSTVQDTNRHPGQYDFNLRLGGKDLLNVDLQGKATFAVNNKGQVTLSADEIQGAVDKNVYLNIGGKLNIRTEDKFELTLEAGRDFLVKGEDILRVRGKQQINVTGTQTTSVGGAVRLTCMEVKHQTVKGVSPLALDGDAYKVDVGAGDVRFNIGDPTAGGLPVPILAPGVMGGFKVSLLAGDFSVFALLGNIDMTTILGTATLSSILLTTVEAQGLAQMKAALVSLDAQVRALNGTSSVDCVVTALRLTQQILNKMIIMYNIHQHPPHPPLLGGPILPPLMQMSPIIPLDVCEKTSIT